MSLALSSRGKVEVSFCSGTPRQLSLDGADDALPSLVGVSNVALCWSSHVCALAFSSTKKLLIKEEEASHTTTEAELV